MASSVTTDHLTSVLKVMHFDFDPGGTDAVDVSWQDMRDFGTVLMSFFHSVGTGAVDAFQILGNAESAGSGTDAVIKTHALGSAPDAVGDYVFLEALDSEFPPLGTSLRYTSASVELAVDTDEGVVTYVFGLPRFAYGSLSSDTIA